MHCLLEIGERVACFRPRELGIRQAATICQLREGKVLPLLYTAGMTADATSLPAVLSADAIEALVSQADPRVLFVEPRILRRVIIQDRRIPGLGLRVPHSKVYTIERERLLVIADRSELGLSPAEELPRRVILLARPTDDEEFARLSTVERLHAFWRLTFHGRVHAEVEQRIEDQRLTSPQIAEFIRLIGAGEFAEIRQVLAKDELLLPPQDDEGAYVEFLAVVLELRYFAPWDQQLFFPAIRQWGVLEPLWSDLPHEQWYRETQPAGTPERLTPVDPEESPLPPSPSESSATGRSATPDPPRSTHLLERADRSGLVGNQVKAAILSLRAHKADPSSAVDQRSTADGYLRQLAQRLQSVWQLSDVEMEAWWRALCSLLTPAAEGYRSLEARILYDLQKVCVAHERGVYRFNVWGWVRTLGGEPLRRELPLLETVQSAKYLRSTADRASSIRIPAADRNRLMALVDEVQTRSDQTLRQTVRPLIEKTFDDVGLVPQNIPERVARRKVIEGLLDRLVERGFITMGDVRDALSQNSLKLLDVSGPLELTAGDRLLRADRKLAQVLDGVYRPGAVYLRASQRLSSLAFGTRVGRLLARHVVLPFGGAFLTLSVLLHYWEGFAGTPAAVASSSESSEQNPAQPSSLPPLKGTSQKTSATALSPPEQGATPPPSEVGKPSGIVEIGKETLNDFHETVSGTIKQVGDEAAKNSDKARAKGLPRSFYVSWFFLGIFLWAILVRPKFRRSVARFFLRLWSASRWLIYELPASVLDSPLVHRILESRGYAILKAYVLRPVGVTLVVLGIVGFLSRQALLSVMMPRPLSWHGWFESFLVFNLFLNSPAGRSVEERVLDICVRAWHELRFRIFAVIFHLVMDLFHDAMQWIEQSLYTVDEWLRFRSGDPRRFVLLKILIGSVWSVVSYVIRFVVTLLVEPQINPIKHFPVVTVAAKVMLPYLKQLGDLIHTFVGNDRMAQSTAYAVSFAIVFLAPGIVGFLAWELKENWQLYVANRPSGTQPVRVGSHGESIAGLLRPGFRSGTLAKLYTKLRIALRIESDPGHGYRSTRQLAQIDAVSLAVRRFVEREFCVLIEEAQLLSGTRIAVGQLQPATNRFDLDLRSSQAPDRPAVMRWEDLNGWLAARIVNPGWLADLPMETRTRVNVALTGLYKLAGVDLVREQVLSAIGQDEPGAESCLELDREAIRILSPTRDSASLHSVVYPLQSDGPSIQPQSGDGATATDWPAVSRKQLLFRETDMGWSEWVEQWPAPGSPPPPPTHLPDLLGTAN